MTSFSLRSHLLWTGVLISYAVPVPAQVLPPWKEPEKQYTINSSVEMVLLDVGVKDSKGGFVSDLRKDNFKVYEDNKPQEISTFTSYDTPVTVGLVVDNSGSMRLKRADTVTAALTFAKESNPQDEMFVVNFNDKVSLGLPAGMDFTDDNNTLRTALLNNPVAGQTALYDALFEALAHLDKGRRDKKTLVLISDGGDNRSQHTLDEVVDLAEKSTATIYAIGIYDPEDKDANPGVLKKLANLTGGYAFFPKVSTQIVDDCRKIAKDIRNRYTLGYTVTNTAYDGKIRKLRVDATSPDHAKMLVRTRTSYIARPRKAPSTTVTQTTAPQPTTGTATTTTAPRTDERPPEVPPSPAPATTKPAVQPNSPPPASIGVTPSVEKPEIAPQPSTTPPLQ